MILFCEFHGRHFFKLTPAHNLPIHWHQHTSHLIMDHWNVRNNKSIRNNQIMFSTKDIQWTTYTNGPRRKSSSDSLSSSFVDHFFPFVVFLSNHSSLLSWRIACFQHKYCCLLMLRLFDIQICCCCPLCVATTDETLYSACTVMKQVETRHVTAAWVQ